jgi:hypothetical protein
MLIFSTTLHGCTLLVLCEIALLLGVTGSLFGYKMKYRIAGASTGGAEVRADGRASCFHCLSGSTSIPRDVTRLSSRPYDRIHHAGAL